VFVEPVTLDGIRDTVSAYGPRHLEARLSRYHGDKTRALFFAWADTWLCDAFRDWNIEACLPRIRCPALIIQGHDDPYGSARQVRAIVAGIGPKARPLLLPDCGHAPHRDVPATVRDAIAAFVAPFR
jgi:pimeloyl-ACP methyl ester carboxylesterase